MKRIKILLLICFFVSLHAQNKFSGIIRPLNDIQLSLALNGTVLELFVKQGTYVKKGDKLLTLDNRLQKLEVEKRKLILNDKSKLDNLINEEKILLSLLKVTKELYSTHAIVSNEEVQAMQVKYQSTLGQLKAVKENEKREKIDFKVATTILDTHSLISPINGIITHLTHDIGEWVTQGKPLIRVVNNSKCLVDLNIQKEFLNNIKNSKSTKVLISSFDETIEKNASIKFISPIADEASGLIFVQVEFDNKDLKIVPGLMATVLFEK